MSHQQQLHAELGRLHGLPSTGVAKHDDAWRECAESRDLRIPDDSCGVFFVPPNYNVGRREIRSQHDWIHAGGNAHVAGADTVLGVPHQRELHVEFDGLHGLPSTGMAEHDNPWRECAESRDLRIPDDSCGVFFVPPNYDVGRREIRSQHNGIPTNQQAHYGSMQPMPHQRKLFAEHRADRLRKFGLPFDDVAADEQSRALNGGPGVRGGKLLDMPHNGGLGCSFV